MSVSDISPDLYDVQVDPYGHGMNQDFMLVTQDELFVLQAKGKGATNAVKVYDNLKAGNTDSSPLALGTDGSVDANTFSSFQNNLSYVQMVSFDPNGTGRNDHIAMVGVAKGGDNNAYTVLIILDKEGNTVYSKGLGKANWMRQTEGGSDDMRDFNAMNFFSITAGKYRGGKRDSLVVYVCHDHQNYGLYEFYKDPDSGQYTCPAPLTSDGKYPLGNQTLLHDKYIPAHQAYVNGNNDNDYVDNKLHCQLRSGDINGDGFEDLVVLSYVNRVTRAGSMRSKVTELYCPSLTVRYGNSGIGDVTNQCDKRVRVWKNVTQNGDAKSNWISMLAAGLAVGDIDGDAKCEIVLAGFMNKIEGNSGNTVSEPYNLTPSKLVTAVYDGEMNQVMFNTSFNTNKWTQGTDIGGLYTADTAAGDQSWQRTAVETVAINGRAKAEHIFINGDLYLFDPAEKTMSVKYQPEYFKSTDVFFGNIDGDIGTRVAETYFRSVAVGVFDGNEAGREQIVYVLGATRNAAPDYAIFKIGMMGGVFQDIDGVAAASTETFYCTEDDAMERTCYPSNGSTNAMLVDYLNYAVCAWDCDSDGLHAKYTRKDYVYTDPQVMAILQAPPYFDEVKDAMTGFSTTYSISTSYSYAVGHGNSTSFGFGFSVDAGTTVTKINFQADARLDWSESFVNELSTTEEYEFTAVGEDQVVMIRTPITIYTYQVETNGTWSNDNTMSLSFPGAPAQEMVNARDYNEFVLYYNEECQRLAEVANRERVAHGMEPIKDEDIPHLELLEDNWLFHEGDPFSYMQTTSTQNDRTILQSSPNSFGIGSSSTAYSWGQDHTHTNEVSVAHGFSLDFAIMWGGSAAFGWEAYGGLHASLEYMREYSTSTSKGAGQGISCEVGNLDPSDLEGLGISRDAAEE